MKPSEPFADEVAPGRSQLWNRRAGGGGSGGGGGGCGSDREEEEEPGVLGESADTLGLDDFDSLLLASQTSGKESPARSSRAARHARDGVTRGGALGAGRGGAGSGGAVAGTCALDVDDSEDEFSMDPVGVCSRGRVTPSGGGDDGGGGGGDSDDAGAVGAVVVSKQQKALERKEATANKKRQRQEAVRQMSCNPATFLAPLCAHPARITSPSIVAFPLVNRRLPPVGIYYCIRLGYQRVIIALLTLATR